jgi:hypothetical protein
MNFEEWFARYPWRNLCEACKGTGDRHEDGVPVKPAVACLDCLGERLQAALMKRSLSPKP